MKPVIRLETPPATTKCGLCFTHIAITRLRQGLCPKCYAFQVQAGQLERGRLPVNAKLPEMPGADV